MRFYDSLLWISSLRWKQHRNLSIFHYDAYVHSTLTHTHTRGICQHQIFQTNRFRVFREKFFAFAIFLLNAYRLESSRNEGCSEKAMMHSQSRTHANRTLAYLGKARRERNEQKSDFFFSCVCVSSLSLTAVVWSALKTFDGFTCECNTQKRIFFALETKDTWQANATLVDLWREA